MQMKTKQCLFRDFFSFMGEKKLHFPLCFTLLRLSGAVHSEADL